MALVQQIDFMLGVNQIMRLFEHNSRMNAVKLSLGVQEDATIVMKAYGVIWNGTDISATGHEEDVCPVPPDCQNNPLCIEKVNSLIDPNFNAEKVFSFQQ